EGVADAVPNRPEAAGEPAEGEAADRRGREGGGGRGPLPGDEERDVRRLLRRPAVHRDREPPALQERPGQDPEDVRVGRQEPHRPGEPERAGDPPEGPRPVRRAARRRATTEEDVPGGRRQAVPPPRGRRGTVTGRDLTPRPPSLRRKGEE